jgi:hypothetical protein
MARFVSEILADFTPAIDALRHSREVEAVTMEAARMQVPPHEVIELDTLRAAEARGELVAGGQA